VALIQEIVTYQVRQRVRSVELRVAIILLLNGAAFAAAAEWVSPWIKHILSRARSTSRRGIGAVGPWLFYAVAYAALYFAFWIVEVRGPGALLVRFVR
jgi:hypothetical protein